MIAVLPLCYPSNTGQFLLPSHFAAPVPPRFTNFLASEIRVKVFDGGTVRTEGKPFLTGEQYVRREGPARQPGFLFGTPLLRRRYSPVSVK